MAVEGTVTPPAAPTNGVAPTTDPAPAAPATGAPPVEAVAKPVAAAAEEKARIAERLAMVARRERISLQKIQQENARLQQEHARLAQAQAQFKQQEEMIQQARQAAQTWEQRLGNARQNPGEFLSALYGPQWYDMLTNYNLEGGKTSPELQVAAVRDQLYGEVQKTRAELEALRKAQEEEKNQRAKAEQERAQREMSQTMQGFQKEVFDFVKANESKYGLTNLFGRQDLVATVIQQHYAATSKEGRPKVLSIEEAAEKVEELLSETATQYEQWKAKKTTPAPAKPEAGKVEEPTLSNGIAAAPSTPISDVPKTKDERMARALSAWAKAEAARQK